ncbi:MAG: TIR domain-containing protein [Bacteroidales bacterium]|nr:TIR domain-containing protein [Bacteroidales bacterium]
MKKRIFVSFDSDNDLDKKNLLVDQSRLNDSPFEVNDWSSEEAESERNWKEKAREKIKRSDIVLVIAGSYTYRASGVKKEVKIAREEKIPIVQIKSHGTNPYSVQDAGILYDWTWENLKRLLG